MINANELRVGNWVNDEFYGDFQIVGLIFFGTNKTAYKKLEYYPESQDIAKLNPIPLTEEWMIRLGFKRFCKDFALKGIIIHTRKRGFVLRKSVPIIKHVHQLQNLYFALTNEELICHT